jgi:hypothetical protein
MSRLLWILVCAGLFIVTGCKEEPAPKEVKQTRKMPKPGTR